MGRFDLTFKSLAEGNNLTLLRLFGHTPIDAATRVEPVERELAMGLKSVDHAYLLERDGERWIEHFEAEVVLSKGDLRLISERAVLLSIAKRVKIWTTIVRLSKRHAGAAVVPDTLVDDRGSTQILMRSRVVNLWETEAAQVLADPDPDAVPLVGAMRASRAEMEEAIRRLLAVTDREQRERLNAEMVTWSSFQYNKGERDELRERLGMVSTKDVLQASPIGEELVEYGRQEGRQEGREEGQLIQARKTLTILAEDRFPGVLESRVVSSLVDLGTIQILFRALIAAANLDDARAAVTRILNQQA